MFLERSDIMPRTARRGQQRAAKQPSERGGGGGGCSRLSIRRIVRIAAKSWRPRVSTQETSLALNEESWVRNRGSHLSRRKAVPRLVDEREKLKSEKQVG